MASVDARSTIATSLRGPLELQSGSLAGGDQLAVLVEGSVQENHDARVGARAALSQIDDLRFDPDGVAVKERLWKAHFVPSEIGDGRSQRRVTDRYANNEPRRKCAVDYSFAEFGVLAAVILVQMQIGRI